MPPTRALLFGALALIGVMSLSERRVRARLIFDMVSRGPRAILDRNAPAADRGAIWLTTSSCSDLWSEFDRGGASKRAAAESLSGLVVPAMKRP